MSFIDEIKDTDESALDKARLEDFLSAYEPNEGETKESYLYLACFASFPVILSSDILYKIWSNFDVFSSKKLIRPPIWSVSQILYSSITKEVGYDLYEIYPSIKIILLTYIKEKMGHDVIMSLAYFMKFYVENEVNKIPTQILREAQKWNYKSYLKKEEVSEKIIELLGKPKEQKIDLDHLLASVSNSAKGTKLGVVVNLAKGLQKYRKGELEHSKDIIEVLKTLNSEKGNSTQGYNIEVPKELLESLRIEPNLETKRTRKLYALIIGINEYSNNRLEGCINDANSIENYLLATENEPIIIKLLDNQATKGAIIEVFENQLNKATEADTVLFYFAGNGTTTIYQNETQNVMSDSIVCFGDNNQNLDEFILVKEEIDYLFFKHISSRIHKIVILDCSFIIDASRRKYQKKKFNNCRERGVMGAIFGGNREFFLFVNENIAYNSINNYTIIYACEDTESAIEVRENGVFTKKLIEYLEETDGEISYNALQGRIKQELKVKYDQRPIVKTSIEENEFKNILFLNRPRQGSVGEVSFDDGWSLNLGSIHGVKKIQKVRIIDKKNKASYEVNIKNVLSTFSYLIIPEHITLIQGEVYQARLEGLELQELKIHVKHFNGNLEIVQALIDKLLEQKDDHFILENNEAEADYTLHIRNEKVYITHPNEIYRPLIEPFELSHQNLNHDLISTFRHLCKFHYVSQMKGDNINIPVKPLTIEVFKINQAGVETKINLKDDKAIIDLELINNKWKGSIKIKVKNNSSQKLYICTAYMNYSFKIDTVFLPKQIQVFEPYSETFLQFKDSNIIPVFLSSYCFEYNYVSETEVLKFIISNNEIDVDALNEKSLKRPVIAKDKEQYSNRGIEQTRKSLGEELNDIIFDEWTCQSLFIEYINPQFNQISKNTLKEMLTFDKMSDFALGIYYDVAKDKLFRPIYKLKPEIRLIDESH